MIFRMIAAKWAEDQGLKPRAFEGEYSFEQLERWNKRGYNCYYFPNYPGDYEKIPLNETGKRKRPIRAGDVDTFNYCFVDLDMKDYGSESPDRRHMYESKQQFIDLLLADPVKPSCIIDTGGGIHAYWRVSDLDAMSFLRLNRRLCRKFSTDPAVSTLAQLMRVPGTLNVKQQDNYRPCEIVYSDPETVYTSEDMSKALPPIAPQDEEYCQAHHDKAYNLNESNVQITDELPKSFLRLCRLNPEIKKLFYETSKDRSAADFRLAHLMFANGVSKDDARNVLFNTSKAAERTKLHRFNYANNIVDKVWIAEEVADKPTKAVGRLARSVKAILESEDMDESFPRFPCAPFIDGTEFGFRLSHVMGLIGGSGNGKTTNALNLFAWFTEHNINKNYIHLFVSLEQPEREIAELWKVMSASLKQERPEIDWDSTVHVLGNYETEDGPNKGVYRELGLKDIQDHIVALEKETGKKVGCCVVDHIGVLKEEKGDSDFGGLIGNCKRLKQFAVATNTFFIIQSQTSRSKNGGGDVELDMDAAFGTSNFENYCDWIMTTWQPLKRVLDRAPHMTVTAFKFPKIRKKNVLKDNLKADCVYGLMFDPNTGRLREMTTDENAAYEFWNKQATQIRNKDRKRDPSNLRVITWTKKADNGTTDAKPTKPAA